MWNSMRQLLPLMAPCALGRPLTAFDAHYAIQHISYHGERVQERVEQHHRPGDDLILCQARSGADAYYLPGPRVTLRARRSLRARSDRGWLAIVRVTA